MEKLKILDLTQSDKKVTQKLGMYNSSKKMVAKKMRHTYMKKEVVDQARLSEICKPSKSAKIRDFSF